MNKVKEDFKNMLLNNGTHYIDLGFGLIIVNHKDSLNIRQYDSDGACLSSWIEISKFIETLLLLPKDKKIQIYEALEKELYDDKTYSMLEEENFSLRRQVEELQSDNEYWKEYIEERVRRQA